jgi:hypothetical protein
MSRNLYLLSTGSMIILALIVITSLRKKYIKKQCEHFTIQPLDHTDLLLDQTKPPTINHASYRASSKKWTTSPMSSFEQTTNNQPHHSPNNGSITLPELSDFYA